MRGSDRTVVDAPGRLFLALASLAIVLPGSSAAQCAAEWERSPGGQLQGWHPLRALAADDAPSPGLFAGGSFTTAGGVAASRVARWDGLVWSPLGTGVDAPVDALFRFDEDGPGPGACQLYAGGRFADAGGISANRIARWDGASWSALGSGMDGDVLALASFDDDGPGPNLEALYAAGDFANAGGVAAQRIAKWDGAAWSPLGTGLDGPVFGLAAFDVDGPGPLLPTLHAVGAFLTAGGTTVNGIASWDGLSWSALGTGTVGLDLPAYALAAFDEDGAGPGLPSLFVGGDFTSAGGAAAQGIARWDGTAWYPVGTGVFGSVHPDVMALLVLDDDGPGPRPEALFAGGGLVVAGGASANYIARWDGAAWSALDAGLGQNDPESHVTCLAAFDSDGAGPELTRLHAGGFFQFESSAGEMRMSIAAWDAMTWSWLGSGVAGTISAFEVFDDDGPGPRTEALYAAGDLLFAGGVFARRVARWDGASWSALDTGVGNSPQPVVEALAVFDGDDQGPNPPELIAGGWFYGAGGSPASCIARWNGASWSPLGSGVDRGPGAVSALATFDADGAGPAPARLYAGGRLGIAGGSLASHIAAWDGVAWSALGTGADAEVLEMLVHDDDGAGPIAEALYVGGQFQTIDGLSASRIARFDGTTWTPLGGGLDGAVMALAAFDEDGDGPQAPLLYAGGSFSNAGGQPAQRLARWDGAAWSDVGGGLDGPVLALATFDDDGDGPHGAALYVGGEFDTAGGQTSYRVARWDGVAWSALAGGPAPASHAQVAALLPFDADGAGPQPSALFAGGRFTQIEGLPSANVARLAACVPPAVSAYCFGDGSGAPCPCGNSGGSGRGCAHSLNPRGTLLATTGAPSLAADTLVLEATGMPNSTCLYFQGTSAVAGGLGVALGDGLRCAGGIIVRLGVAQNSGGSSQFPAAGQMAISTHGPYTAGDVRSYQAWYRNADPAFCMAATFNLTNGISAIWSP